ncbi:hypothetical protein V8E36_000111 [Tilletia maclaganii]
MPTSVLFHCPCTGEPRANEPPSLPSYSPAAVYSYFPLPNLYFCDDCDQVRCDQCLNIEISLFFCPNCLFTIQSSHIKEQQNRCDRNCFLCPICTNTLVTVPSDPDINHPPESKEASMGGAPYYLFCTCCKWDSKEIRLEFERPTGLSMQLQRSEEQSSDALELQKLQEHFASVLKASAQETNAAAGQRGTPAALRASKLLRDVPSLATNTKYLQGRSHHHALPSLYSAGGRGGAGGGMGPGGSGGAAGGGRPEPITEWSFPGDPRPYEAQTSFAPATLGEELSVLGRIEESNRDFVRATSDDQLITSLEQRWTSSTLPPRVKDLRPQRVPASYRATKRCSVCNHICIRPDVKTGYHRFKIKTFFANYVPDIGVQPAALQPLDPHADPAGGGGGAGGGAGGSLLMGGAGSRLGRSGRASLSLRTGAGRPQSVFGPAGLGLGPGGLSSVGAGGSALGGPSSSSSTSGSSSNALVARAVDVENLRPGRKYLYELVFTNPLGENMNVSIVIAKPSAAAVSGFGFGFAPTTPLPFGSGGGGAELRSPRLGEDTPLSPGGTSTNAAVPSTSTPLRLPWQVTPSAETFPVAPNNDLLDDLDGAAALGNVLDDTADLLDDDGPAGAELDDVHEEGEDGGEGVGEGGGGATRSLGSRRVGKRRGPAFKQSGHRTTITLELALGNDASGEIEFGLFVSYNTFPEGSNPRSSPTRDRASSPTKGGTSSDKGLSFWTAVRLGRCAPRASLSSGGGGHGRDAVGSLGSWGAFEAAAGSSSSAAAAASPPLSTGATMGPTAAGA